MKTYEEILNNMKKAYFEASGSNLSENAEALSRIKAAASELYNISCYSDFVLKQMFYQSASGTYLDLHANICGLKRKTPGKARGSVSFSVSIPYTEDIIIPSGVICSVKDNPFIQFVTTGEARLPAGQLSAEAEIEALGFGEDYNVAENSITVMVNPPVKIESVCNNCNTSGGSFAESDESLRRRIEASYDFIHNGISKKYYMDRLRNIEDMLDCNLICQTDSEIIVVCRTKSGTISNELETEINNILGAVALFGGSVSIINAVAKAVDFNIIVRGGQKADITEVLQKYFHSIMIGESIIERKCERLIIDACSALECEVNASTVSAGSDEYFTLGEVNVYYYDE